MTEFISEIKTVPHADVDVYTVLSDLSNLEMTKGKVSEDVIKDMSFDKDSCTITVDPVGKIRFVVVEREPNKTIKFQSDQLPFDLTMWIQLKASGDEETKMKLTIQADLNPFLKPMVSKPLQSGLDKVAEGLSALPYTDILNKGSIEE